jgi:hypothetical protein
MGGCCASSYCPAKLAPFGGRSPKEENQAAESQRLSAHEAAEPHKMSKLQGNMEHLPLHAANTRSWIANYSGKLNGIFVQLVIRFYFAYNPF